MSTLDPLPAAPGTGTIGYASFAGSICNVGVVCGDAVAARMKDERLAVTVFVLLDLAQKDDVVASVVLSDFAANELGNHAVENRNAVSALAILNSRKLIRQRGRELPRQVMLMRFQHVDGEVSCIDEIGEARGLA